MRPDGAADVGEDLPGDVSLEEPEGPGVLFVHWQRTATSTGVVEKEPKGKSRRAIALGPAVVRRTARAQGDTGRGEG